MTTAVTPERPAARPEPPALRAKGRPLAMLGDAGLDVGTRLHGLLGAMPTAVLWGLVALWTVPTLGTLVSSFRPRLSVRTTGWWTEFPNPLPDRFGRTVLAALLVVAVVLLLAQAASRRTDVVRRVAAGVAALALVAVTSLGYAEMYATLPNALLLLLVVAAIAVVWKLLSWGFDRLNRPGRIVLVIVIVAAVVVGLAIGMTELTLDNYREVFSTTGGDAPNMWRHFLNSVAITLPATIIPITIAAFAAYAFAWMDFRGRHWLFIGVVAMLAVPFQMSLVPLLQLYNNGAHLTVFGETFTLFPDLDLAASRTSVWLTHIGFGLPLAVFLLHNYIAGLPRDLFEAARIDGADHPTIFWRLVLPLSVPALAAFAIFQFLWVWNDYLVARTFLGSGGAGFDNAPMTIRLATLSGSRGLDWHLLTSAAFVSIAVPLIIFFGLQRYFVRGLLAGSVKG